MSPRAYRSEQRQAATSETRRRIVEAAREVLSASPRVAFTIDTVADRAGVARMTVYHQFGSKTGLIEALADDLARRGGIGRLPEAFTTADAMVGLSILVDVFVGLWASQREVVRGLRAFTQLDPESAHEDRNARRHQAIRTLLHRLAAQTGRPGPDEIAGIADVLQVLTSFEAYEALSMTGREPKAVAALIHATARALLNQLPMRLS